MDLLWTDIETTSLDERGGLVLELGLILTRGDRFEVAAEFSSVVGYPDIRSRVRDEFVRIVDRVIAARQTRPSSPRALAWRHLESKC